MYGESGVMLPCDSVQQFDDFYHCSHKFFTNCHLDNLIQQASTVSEYDLGGEGDLFKAPQPIIQQPLDPITIISCGQQQDAISQHQLEVADIQHDFLNHVFYECKNLLAKEEPPPAPAPAPESSPLSEVISFGFPVKTDEVPPVANEIVDNTTTTTSCQIPKSISSDSLNSMDWIQLNSNFLNFTDLDFGMRRAFSEGDIKTLSDANTSVNYYPFGQPPLMTEDRMQKLSRYRNKKTKRNFGRKIKYACRKALADTQPRIRGRFAKTDTS